MTAVITMHYGPDGEVVYRWDSDDHRRGEAGSMTECILHLLETLGEQVHIEVQTNGDEGVI